MTSFQAIIVTAIEEYRKKLGEGYDTEVAEQFAIEEALAGTGYLGLTQATECCGVLPDTVERHAVDCEHTLSRIDHVDLGPQVTLPEADTATLLALRSSITALLRDLRYGGAPGIERNSETAVLLEFLGPILLNLASNTMALKALHSMHGMEVPEPIRATHLNQASDGGCQAFPKEGE